VTFGEGLERQQVEAARCFAARSDPRRRDIEVIRTSAGRVETDPFAQEEALVGERDAETLEEIRP
jgi:hypothetical protein